MTDPTTDPTDEPAGLFSLPVVLPAPPDGAVTVRADVPWGAGEGRVLDLYRPASARDARLPAVVLVTGFPEPGFARALGRPLKDTAPVPVVGPPDRGPGPGRGHQHEPRSGGRRGRHARSPGAATRTRRASTRPLRRLGLLVALVRHRDRFLRERRRRRLPPRRLERRSVLGSRPGTCTRVTKATPPHRHQARVTSSIT